jgi:branched-chain amino acid transport system ATP-binding protein
MKNHVADQTVALEAHALVKKFSGFTAVDNVNFKVHKGSLHSLIGPNGAGKTTLFNLLTKSLAPTSGTIYLNGQDITKIGASEVAGRGMIRSFQISSVFSQLTVMANVKIALQRHRGTSFDFWRSSRVLEKNNDRAHSLLVKVGLESFASQFAGNLSYGRRRALELATTLAIEPSVMLLDEPMAGLAREDIAMVTELIRTVARDRTVVMVEHNLAVVATLSDTISVLARGSVLAEGDYQSIVANPDVQLAYLGK